MALLIFIFGLLLFVGLVVVHELGHFLVARRNGVEVEEFGIGFPPRAWKKRIKSPKGDYDFTLNWLPLGGFVKLKGEHDSDTEKGSFGAASLVSKVKIMLAGVAMNFVTAVMLFTLLAAVGMPKANLESLPFYNKEQFTVKSDTKIVQNNVYIAVVKDSPAAKAGLQDGDEIIRIGKDEVGKAANLPGITEKYKGREVEISYKRGTADLTTKATLLEKRSPDMGYLGVGPADSQMFRATWSAPIVGIATTVQFTEISFRGLGYVFQNLFTGQTEKAQEAVGGPVATFKIISDTSSSGLLQVLFVIALISVSLAVMNVLPIPALDGGRLFITLVYRALKRKLTHRAEELIHGTGFAVLLALIALITFIDIKRFF